MRKLGLVFVLVAWVAPAWATVITTGDVDPGGAAIQPDPWNIGGSLKVGDTGEGTLNVESGGVVTNTVGDIGKNSGSTGVATVTGVDSKWNNLDDLTVGSSGSGTLNVESGGVVTNTIGYIGAYPGSTGIATISGEGSWWDNTGSLSVGYGYGGNGTLNIEAEGEVSNSDGYIGRRNDSTGIATVTGVGSKWNNSSALIVGSSGSGTLNVEAGGVVSSFYGYIGDESGSTGEVTISGEGSWWDNTGSLSVGYGYGGNGTLTVADGGLVTNADDGYIGKEAGSTGVATVTGVGSKWTNSGLLSIGSTGSGTLNVAGGGEVSNSYGVIGYESGSSGTATVTGIGSKWTISAPLGLYVGYYGGGTLNVEAGGEVSSGFYGYIGDESGSTGEVTITGAGSKWTNSGTLYVGRSGNGTLNVAAGGEVSNSSWGSIGDESGSTGEVTITGAGSKWTNSGTLYVGYYGDGTLNVAAGGEVSNSYGGYIGDESGSTGEVTVTGAGSKWTNSRDLTVGHEGDGTLNIEAGGEVSSNYRGSIGDESGSTGEVTVTGAGSKWTNSRDLTVGRSGNGTLNVIDGGVVSSAGGYIGDESGSTGEVTVTGAGSKWTNSSSLYVGDYGDGTLNITDGGLVEAGSETWVGKTNDSSGFIHFDNGTLTTGSLFSALADLSGTGTIHTHGLVSDVDLVFDATHGLTQSFALSNPGQNISVHLDVDGTGAMGAGHSSSGTLRIADGVMVDSMGQGYVGYQSGSTGIATVTGAGSKWTNSRDLTVGHEGDGTLNIEAGGEVSSNYGYIGDESGSTGVATISGAGSKWTNSSSLYVGDYGEGTLNIEAGGEVASSYGYIGVESGSTGIATVSGAGSKWTNSSTLRVGEAGSGTLNIESAGVVTNTDGYIGKEAGSTGTATVTDVNSKWTNSGRLYVGYEGDGTLNITDGGLVEAGSDTWVGKTDDSTGSIHFDNGTLSTGGLVSSLDDLSGTGTIHTHGLVSDVDLVFDATHGLTQSFALANPGQNISVHLDVNGTGAMGAGYSSSGTLRIADGATVASELGLLGFKSGSSGEATVTGIGSKWTNSSSLYVGDYGGGTLNVEAGGEVSSNYGSIGDESGSTGEVTITGAGSKWTNSSNLDVGRSGSGTLNVEAGGEVSSTYGYIGRWNGSTGEVTISGAGSKWTNSSSLRVGDWGDGTLNIESGGVVSSSGGVIGGGIDSTGVATVTGVGSKWTNSGGLYVGRSGNGTLNVIDGGVVSSAGGSIGDESGSTGEVTVTGAGSKWTNSSSLTVGHEGDGTLNIEAGGEVFNSSGYIGHKTGSTGIATVSGAGSKWTNSSTLRVGEAGSGTLNIESAGVVTNTDGYIGKEAGSTGTATVTDVNSKWTNSGRLYVGYEGDGTLNITDGGLVEAGSDTWVGKTDDSSGFIHFDNGTLTTGSLFSALADLSGTGTIHTHGLVSDVDLVFDATHGLTQSFALANPGQNISVHLDVNGTGAMGAGYSSSGTLRIADGATVASELGLLGFKSGSSGEATVTGIGSKWTNSSSLYVGDYGDGTLNVEAGGVVANTDGHIGYNYGSSGMVTVTGAGSKWTNTVRPGDTGRNHVPSYSLIVGDRGNGTLNISDGGEVSNTVGSIGRWNGSTGEVTISGEGSWWTNSSSLYVGEYGDGTLNIESGGVVSSFGGVIGGGHSSGWWLGNGIATVTGAGSKWTNSGILYVGRSGNGTLNVEAGGEVSSEYGPLPFRPVGSYIGYYAGSTGTATVTGAGSKWTNSESLVVGYEGNGSLNVEAGGLVTNADDGYIGKEAGSTGVATVTGANSKWTNSGSLYVGYEGDGTLNITDGGLVEAGGNTYVTAHAYSTGVIHFDNGTLTTGSLYSALADLDGTGTINTHGLVSDVDLIFDATHGLMQSFTLTNPGQNIAIHLDVDETGAMGAGYSSSGTLRIADGVTVASELGLLGFKSGSSGEATVTGTGSKWTNSGSLAVGYEGNGTLNVEAGAEVSNSYGYIGEEFGSTGIATISGAGSKWTNSIDLEVGGPDGGGVRYSDCDCDGTLNLYDSGLVTVSDTTKLWSTGTINLAGGNLTTGSFDNSEAGVLNFDDGTLTVSGVGGSFNPGTSDFTIDGSTAADVPKLVIAGLAHATLSGNLTVGSYKQGKLTVLAGGEVSNSYGYIGNESGATGIATVTGVNSKWTNSLGLYVGHEGNGTLNVAAGGEVSNSYRGSIGGYSSSTGIATVTGSGSKWTNSGLLYVGYYGDGTLNVAAGGEVSNSYGGYIGHETGSTGTATVSGAGSKWTNSGWLTVGGEGNGTLNVEAGGVVSSSDGFIGDESGSTGEVTISGEGSWWTNTTNLVVGFEGNGTLNVAAGGEVFNFWGHIGLRNDSTGEVTVSGEGSQWTNSNYLIVGSSGSGTLNVEAGGEVSNSYGYIGKKSGSTGIATVTGDGSTWTNSGFLYVGYEGNGTLNIEAGGEVFNSSGYNIGLSSSYIGLSSSSTGTATISGAGSKWTNSGRLYVGYYGDGTLNVAAGGEVSNSYGGYIGHETGSTGIATVTGVGSKWTNSNSLNIGGRNTVSGGSGTLNINDSGLVTVADTTKLWDEGTINLDGGILDTGTLDLELGTFNMVDGLLRADNVIGDINVPGGIVAPGHSPGVLAITGDYSQGAAATLEIEVTGTSAGEAGYDQLSVGGIASLDGTLDIQTDASFTPSVGATVGVIGDSFVIVSAGSVTGTFATINGRHVGDGKFYLPQYSATQVTLGAFQAAPGDTDGDMDIDLSDYNTITTNFDPSGTYGPYLWQHGNSDGDNDIDLADYNAVASNFQPLGYGAAAVPEPSTALLALLGMLLISVFGRLSVLN